MAFDKHEKTEAVDNFEQFIVATSINIKTLLTNIVALYQRLESLEKTLGLVYKPPTIQADEHQQEDAHDQSISAEMPKETEGAT